jgi:hypothetical protein
MIRTIRLALLAALAFGPALAAAGEEVYLLQSQESSDVATNCTPEENVVLGAYLYAPRPRAVDALVMRDLGEPIGTAIGCGQMTLANLVPMPGGAPSPFRMEFHLPRGVVTASGQCVVAEAFRPVANVPYPMFLVGCTLKVDADPEAGVLHGFAASASVFLPFPIPGLDTGSYWTLHLYTADPAGATTASPSGASR